MFKIITIALLLCFSGSIIGQTTTSQKPSTGRGLTNFLLDYLDIKYSDAEFGEFIYIGIKRQKLYHIKADSVYRMYHVSTASKGAGNENGSYKTPTGLHYISEKIGDSIPIGGVFVDRIFTGEIAKIETQPIDHDRDVITTRILTLGGQEDGFNTGNPDYDSHDRYIYIHGTAEEGLIGTAASHGCIRMNNEEIINLFNEVDVKMNVIILNN